MSVECSFSLRRGRYDGGVMKHSSVCIALVAVLLAGMAPEPAASADPSCSGGELCVSKSGGFDFALPAGWLSGDPSQLSYGQALLLKQTARVTLPGQPTATSTETSILLGRFDMTLFAATESDNGKAAARLASDMGEFFMPFSGTRINQQSTSLEASDMSGSASSFEVKFEDMAKPNGQIWAGVIGLADEHNEYGNRWFVVWLGTSNDPVDTEAAKALAESIRPTSISPQAEPTTRAASPTPSPRDSSSAIPDMGRYWFLSNLGSIEVNGAQAGMSDRSDQTLVDIGLSACEAIRGRGDEAAELVADQMVKDGTALSQYEADIFVATAVTAFCDY
jgi:hypothetical protein